MTRRLWTLCTWKMSETTGQADERIVLDSGSEGEVVVTLDYSGTATFGQDYSDVTTGAVAARGKRPAT